VIAAFFSIGTITGLSFFMPLYLELSLRTTALWSGVALIAFMVGITLGAMTAGMALARLRHYKRIPLAALAASITALAVLAATPHLPFAAVALLLMLTGGGIGPMYPTTTVLIQNAVPRHHIGIATGTLNFFRLLGGTIVVAGFGAIVLGGRAGGPGPLVHGLPHPGSTAANAAAVFAWVFAAAGGCLMAALAALLIVEEQPLRGPDAGAARSAD
jgi:MFS family permease